MSRPNSPSSPAILSFGEVLWDVYGAREAIGGAPLNVAAHLARLGVCSYLFSRVGNDSRGQRAQRFAEQCLIRTDWLQRDSVLPTGWVDVALDASGQPTFHIGKQVAWDRIEAPTGRVVDDLKQVGFSAIVCGSLAQRCPEARQALVAIRAALPTVPVFYDVNLRGEETPMHLVRDILPGVTILKVNQEEAAMVSSEICGRDLPPRELFLEMRRRFGVRLMLHTRGAEGSQLFAESGEYSVQSPRVEVVSAVGAGDAFSAGFLASWVSAVPSPLALANASELGAFVAANQDAVPSYTSDLLRRLVGLPRVASATGSRGSAHE